MRGYAAADKFLKGSEVTTGFSFLVAVIRVKRKKKDCQKLIQTYFQLNCWCRCFFHAAELTSTCACLKMTNNVIKELKEQGGKGGELKKQSSDLCIIPASPSLTMDELIRSLHGISAQ